MVLVDTSVWIRAFANRAPFRDELDRLLSLEQVAGHELVFGELLIGDPGGHRKVLDRYERFHHASLVPHSHIVHFVRERGLRGRGVGWIDIHLLASAIVDRMQFWTADEPCATLARELGVAYDQRR